MNVKIITPEPGAGATTGAGTRCILPSGEELQGVAGLDIRIRPDDIVRVEAELCFISLEVSGELVVKMAHPVTGDWSDVKTITFTDGTTWTAE